MHQSTGHTPSGTRAADVRGGATLADVSPGTLAPKQVSPHAVDRALWMLSAALLVGVVYLSLAPQGPPGPFPLADKLQHVVAYLAMTVSFLLAAAWRPGRVRRPSSSAAVAVVAGAILLGIALEVAQAIDPLADRTPDVFDAVADAVGALVGYLAWEAVRRKGLRQRPT